MGQILEKKGVTWDLRVLGSLVLVLLSGIKRPNLLTFLERLYQSFRETGAQFLGKIFPSFLVCGKNFSHVLRWLKTCHTKYIDSDYFVV